MAQTLTLDDLRQPPAYKQQVLRDPCFANCVSHFNIYLLFFTSISATRFVNIRQLCELRPKMTPEPTKSTMPSDSQAAEAEASKTVDDLGQQHCDVFTRALFNILSTSIAETTFAQILDGAPLSQNVRNAPRRTYPRTHPVCTQHPELCPGVLDRTRHIRNAFFPQELKFDGRV